MRTCPVCESELLPGLAPWLLRCGACGFECSTLPGQVSAPGVQESIDEAARAQALELLRARNFRIVLQRMAPLRGQRMRLLDVGCAHGWFLQAAADAGWQAVGIEPDPRIALVARKAGFEVRVGSFPYAVAPDETFDAITFHDVFEHLPEVNEALRACTRSLAPGGLLVINLPDARGPFYRTARLLGAMGIQRPLERLWQKDFPSPHLSYFTAPLLRRLAGKHGFRSVYGSRLTAVTVRGLWSRLRYDRTASVVGSGIVFAGTLALIPVLRLLPPDISLEIFERS
jgi:SAM-dependent methyltransferase